MERLFGQNVQSNFPERKLKKSRLGTSGSVFLDKMSDTTFLNQPEFDFIERKQLKATSRLL